MHVNIIACLLAIGFFGGLTALDLRGGIPSQEGLSNENEGSANTEVGKADAYKVAVLLSIGAAVLSLLM
jgi:hypothetical protein